MQQTWISQQQKVWVYLKCLYIVHNTRLHSGERHLRHAVRTFNPDTELGKRYSVI